MRFLVQHEKRDHERNDREAFDGARDVFVIGDDVAEEEKAADGVHEKTGLIDDGSSDAEDKNDRSGTKDGPAKEKQVEAVQPAMENAVWRREESDEHSYGEGDDEKTKDKKMHAGDEEFLGQRNQKRASEKRNDEVLARQKEDEEYGDQQSREDEGVQERLVGAATESEIFWLHFPDSLGLCSAGEDRR